VVQAWPRSVEQSSPEVRRKESIDGFEIARTRVVNPAACTELEIVTLPKRLVASAFGLQVSQERVMDRKREPA